MDDWQEKNQCRLKKEHLARKILGVNDDADVITIRKAFWLLAMKYHPDKCPQDAESHKKFANMVSAYEYLVKGDLEGWKPVDKTEESKIGKYNSNKWGYFCWWKEMFS